MSFRYCLARLPRIVAEVGVLRRGFGVVVVVVVVVVDGWMGGLGGSIWLVCQGRRPDR